MQKRRPRTSPFLFQRNRRDAESTGWPPIVSLLALVASFIHIVGLPSIHLDFPITDGTTYFEMARQATADRQLSPLFIYYYAIFHGLLPGQPMEIYHLHRLAVLSLGTFSFWLIARRVFSLPLALLLTLHLCGPVTRSVVVRQSRSLLAS